MQRPDVDGNDGDATDEANSGLGVLILSKADAEAAKASNDRRRETILELKQKMRLLRVQHQLAGESFAELRKRRTHQEEEELSIVKKLSEPARLSSLKYLVSCFSEANKVLSDASDHFVGYKTTFSDSAADTEAQLARLFSIDKRISERASDFRAGQQRLLEQVQTQADILKLELAESQDRCKLGRIEQQECERQAAIIDQLTAEFSATRNEVLLVREQNNALHLQQQSAAVELSSLDESMQQLNVTRDTFLQEKQALAVSIAESDNLLKASEVANDDLQKQIDGTRGENANRECATVQLKQEVESKLKQCADWQKGKESKTAALSSIANQTSDSGLLNEEKVESLRDRESKLAKKVDVIRQQLIDAKHAQSDKLQASSDEMQAKKDALAAILAERTEQLLKQNAEIRQLDNSIKRAIADVGDETDRDTLTAEVEALRTKYKALLREPAAAEKEQMKAPVRPPSRRRLTLLEEEDEQASNVAVSGTPKASRVAGTFADESPQPEPLTPSPPPAPSVRHTTKSRPTPALYQKPMVLPPKIPMRKQKGKRAKKLGSPTSESSIDLH